MLETFATRLRSAIVESVATPKRDAAKPAGVETWFKYYAGFSPTFARAVLSSAGLTSTATVLDPWNGSGTTTHAAASLGFRAVGVDISPVANVVAAAKVANAADLAHSEGIASQVVANARSVRVAREEVEGHPLRRWMHSADVKTFLTLYRALLELLARSIHGRPVDPVVTAPPPLAAFFLLCLLGAARAHAGVQQSTNPTWVKPPARRVRLRGGTRARYTSLASTFRERVRWLTQSLDGAPGSDPGLATIVTGDARDLPVEDQSVDLIVTSPPYCTRLDYPVSTSFELAALGIANDTGLRQLRYSAMGTPLVRKEARIAPSWPPSVRHLLTAIERHPSKNSATYYLQTYKQYFCDAHASLAELRRVLRDGARAVMVLQTSFYKEISIPLPDLYVDVASTVGLRGTTIMSFPVQKVLTTINPTSQRHLAHRRYVESVIALEAA